MIRVIKITNTKGHGREWHGGRGDTGGSTGERNNTKIIWGDGKREDRDLAQGRGDAATLSPGHLSLALELRWEKALASASHMITKHTEFVGVFN